MLIDTNAYIGHWPFIRLKHNTCSTLLKRMDKNGIDMAVVSSLNGVFYKNTQSANEELYEELQSDKRFKGRFLPFAVINPIYSGWKYDFETSIGKMGMKGIRLYPKYHRYSLEEPACIELVKMARDHNIPVGLCLRMVDSRPSSWLDIMEEWALKDVMPIIRSVPGAKYLIVNIANSTALNEEELALMKQADVLIDTSGRAVSDLGKLIKVFGKEKFAFGTHSPILDDCTGLLRIESLRKEEADEDTKNLIRYGNAQSFFGI